MCDFVWYNELLGLNPVERKRRDLIVAFAENAGGSTERYLREVYPRFWQKVDWRESFDQIAPDLRLGPKDEARILSDMARFVVPALREAFPAGPVPLRKPETVGHIE